MASDEWLKKRYKMEAMVQHMAASPNPGPAPVKPEDVPTAPSSPYEKGKSPYKLAHQGHTPDSTYDDYGRPEDVPRYKGGSPGGKQIEIPWMKEEYQKKHPELEKLHNEKYHQAMDYPPPSELDKWLQLYQRNGGSLRHLDPDLRKLILQRGAMKAELPANNIRRLRDSGHKTDYTGGFRLGDDGQLIPQLGITKADASNNIRRLSESGHQTVLDDNRPGNLKIIKQFKPKA